jgi:hypothetical protein
MRKVVDVKDPFLQQSNNGIAMAEICASRLGVYNQYIEDMILGYNYEQ